MPSNYGSSRACLSRWAPFDPDHGPGQRQLPLRSDYGPWVLDSNARGSTRPASKVGSAEARGNVFHAPGGVFEQQGEFVLIGLFGRIEFVFEQQSRH